MHASLATPPAISDEFGITPALLCLGQRVPSEFHFMLHKGEVGDCSRESRGGAHTQYKSDVRKDMRFIEKSHVILNFYKTEVYCLSSSGLREIKYTITEEREKNCIARGTASMTECLRLSATLPIDWQMVSLTRIMRGVHLCQSALR